GIRLDVAATAAQAKALGRDPAAAAQVPLVFTRDRSVAEATWQTLATDLAVAPQDAHFQVAAEGIEVHPAQAGRRFDPAATWQALTAATQSAPFGEVAVATVPVPPQVSDAALTAALATVHRLSDTPLVLNGTLADGSAQQWTLAPSQLRQWLQVQQAATGPPTVQPDLDAAAISAYLQSLTADVQRDPTDAKLTLPNYATTATLSPDAPGRRLNIAASLAAVQQATVAGAARSAALVIDSVPATVSAASLQPLKDQLDTMMRDGLRLTYGADSYLLKGSKLALALYVEPNPGATPAYAITLNENDLNRLVSTVALNVDSPAQNAAYRMGAGGMALVKNPHDGLRVDRVATAAVLRDALLTGKAGAALPTLPVTPEFGATDQAGQIVTPDLLQSDSTSYAGSSPERNWNVTYGASKLDGWVIPPGATFSTSDALGDLTVAAGFKLGWGILVQNGDVNTIPSEGGGICQVVTTLFHPVFWAGLPIVERRNHSYWIASYGRKPLGLQGLDATVSPPDTDFRFKNTTGNWLLIRAKGDGQTMRVELWGTNPGWRVAVSDPVITNVVKTDQAPRYATSDKLAVGRKLQVEHAQDGFTADIHRQVYDRSGAQIDDWHAHGTYLPSHNTWMTGTGKAASP
ncbi:MAG: VanW family protein, partial [Chloroflexota bacterium]|nr:VanW family protein [Chloroflexota bacterium]